MLASPKHLLAEAQKGRYAIGAFNTSTIAQTKAIISAAEKLRAPVIIQTSEGEARFGKIIPFYFFLKEMARLASVPIVFQQDHCHTVELAKLCIALGYPAILFDGSALPYKKNVAFTKKVVDLAHKKRIFVEGELGGFGEGSIIHKGPIPKILLTDPDQALDFVKKTKVDSLGVSIGNVHGVYKKAPKIDFKRLAEIRKKVSIPLVLHGSSGMRGQDVKKVISLGISKVNVSTDLRIAFASALRKALKDPEAIVPYKYMIPAEKAVQKVVEERIKLFGSAGRA